MKKKEFEWWKKKILEVYGSGILDKLYEEQWEDLIDYVSGEVVLEIFLAVEEWLKDNVVKIITEKR